MQELAELYAQSDVLINPTYADTFPTVNLEALACSTPVITYRTGGSPEAFDEQTGVVIPQGDVEALAKAIQQMREHPLSREACRKRAEELFDKDTCFENYIKLYDSLITNINKG
jgi:glycosyltransferase involved in cell wall biosynthesis